MCGIAGITGAPGTDLGTLRAPLDRMIAALRHRGPDDAGTIALGGSAGEPLVLLGSTRLAILDTTPAAHQPMLDPATGNGLVFDGELYNHREVRAELGDEPPWRSTGDTETLLRAFGRWGIAGLNRFRGMFALALREASSGDVWIARDRMGIKPLYWAEARGHVLFASEVRALLASGLFTPRLDLAALGGYVRFGSVVEPYGMVEGVRSLPAGAWMRLRGGAVAETRRYWSLGAPVDGRPRRTREEIAGELERAVREHLLSDVPVACFLSGGIDSSVISILAAGRRPEPMHTFTVEFSDAALDESEIAALVAARCGTRHQRVVLSDPEVTDCLPEAVEAMDLPTADGINTFIVSRAVARAGVKVVLSGVGGDELFGGYRSFRLLPRAERASRWIGAWPAPLRTLALGGGEAGRRAAEMFESRAPLARRYDALRSFWSRPNLAAMAFDPEVGFGGEDLSQDAPLASRISALELTGYMRSTLLRDSDFMSMAHSIELRMPLLDHVLVECCLESAAADSRSGGRPKGALIEAVGERLPERVWRRRKQGFVLPMERWMRGPLRGLVADGMERLAEGRIVTKGDVAGLKSRFEAGRLPWARLWEFVVLGHWIARHGLSRD